MKLEEIKNEYVGSDGTKTKIVPIGNGSPELGRILTERLGVAKIFLRFRGKWRGGGNGRNKNSDYGLPEKDLALFNAYNHLEAGMEMVGYGDNTTGDRRYEYFNFDVENEKFPLTDAHDFIKRENLIYARRKKEEEKPELVIEVGKRYVTRGGKKTEPIKLNSDPYFSFITLVDNQYRSYLPNGDYYGHHVKSEFDLISEYTPPANTININGYEVPEPVREPLKNGKDYYAASPHTRGKPYLYKWVNCEFDKHALKNGLIHLSKKAVKKHDKALRSFTKLNK